MTKLAKSWQRMWHGIGAREDGAALRDEILSGYAQAQRNYHTLQHLGECIEWFDAVAGLALHAAEVEAALWFHDAIYDLDRHDNEEQSAMWARTALLKAGAPAEAAGRVEKLVLATRHNVLPELPDEQLLVDIDLSILGTAEARFAQYEAQIRQEYSFVPEARFREKRRTILQSFLDRPRIYSTAHFQTALEQRARENLHRAVQ